MGLLISRSATTCVLVLSRSGAATDSTTSVAVTADFVVSLAMRTTPELDRHSVPLLRLWPAVAAREAGQALEATAPPGFALQRLRLARPDQRLY